MKRLAALALIVMAGCDQSAPQPPAAEVRQDAPASPGVDLAKGCADGWDVSLDMQSFASNGARRNFPNERLDAFLGAAAIAAMGAVNAACAAGEIPPATAIGIKSLTVASASGAADPIFVGGGTGESLKLEFAFAEADLTIPSEMELRAGLACWTDSKSPQCLAMEP